mmetsp:Transcript_11808/g.33239  ORF Transcript_11808/g.33239 Transcript_11808/m.33239 type:complete len:208 (+) Transcript_11808:829-1452(+)
MRRGGDDTDQGLPTTQKKRVVTFLCLTSRAERFESIDYTAIRTAISSLSVYIRRRKKRRGRGEGGRIRRPDELANTCLPPRRIETTCLPLCSMFSFLSPFHSFNNTDLHRVAQNVPVHVIPGLPCPSLCLVARPALVVHVTDDDDRVASDHDPLIFAVSDRPPDIRLKVCREVQPERNDAPPHAALQPDVLGVGEGKYARIRSHSGQ